MSFAIAVTIAGSALRSSARRAARRRPAAVARGRRRCPWRRSPSRHCRSASSVPPRSNVSRNASAAAASVSGAVAHRLLAQQLDLARLHDHRVAHVGQHAVEVALALAQERVEEARRAGVMAAPLRAPGEQAAVLEEDVRELPDDVVEGLDELLADVRIGRGRLDLPLRAERREGHRQRPARPRGGQRRRSSGASAASPKASTTSSARASSATSPASGPRSPSSASAGSARLPTITGCTNSTAT